MDPCTGPTIRAALEKLRPEFPDWTIGHVDGYRPHWTAMAVFTDPPTLVMIECLTAAGLRTRIVQNSWHVTLKF